MFLFQSRKGQCCSCTSIDTSSNRIARELFVVKGIRGLETSWTKLDLPKVCKCQVSKHYTNNKITRLQWRIQERGPGPPLTGAQRTKKKIGGGGLAPPPPQSHGLDPVLHMYPSSRLTPHPSSAYLWWRFWMEEIHSRHHFFFREGVVKKSHAYARYSETRNKWTPMGTS